MHRLLPLCFILAACGTDTPPPADAPSEIAVAAPAEVSDTAAVESVANAPSPAETVDLAETPAVDPVLVKGHGGPAYGEDDEGMEWSDLSALPLADALRERYFNVLGGTGGSLLFEDDGSGRSGRVTVSAPGSEDDIGSWRLDGGILRLDTPGRGEVRYTITERSETGMGFEGPDGALRLEDTAG